MELLAARDMGECINRKIVAAKRSWPERAPAIYPIGNSAESLPVPRGTATANAVPFRFSPGHRECRLSKGRPPSPISAP